MLPEEGGEGRRGGWLGGECFVGCAVSASCVAETPKQLGGRRAAAALFLPLLRARHQLPHLLRPRRAGDAPRALRQGEEERGRLHWVGLFSLARVCAQKKCRVGWSEKGREKWRARVVVWFSFG